MNARMRRTLTDNGLGMTKEVQEKAFTLFFSSKGSGGTGLGLAICRELARRMDGEVGLVSEPGEGSVFFARLRIGIGRPAERVDVTGHVLGQYSMEESDLLDRIVARARDAVVTVLTKGLKDGMNRFNDKQFLVSL